MQKLHLLLWTKHKKEMAEKKELATFLFNTNEEVRVLYFRFYAICKEKNAELDREYEKVQKQYAEAKDLYDKYKTERNLGKMIRLFGKMLLIIEPNIATCNKQI